MKKRVIGLTGNSGAGKSTAAACFARLGAEIIDADEISRALSEPGKSGWAAIRGRFGKEYFRKDGTLDRHALGAYVFTDEAARRVLNALLHPLIAEEIRGRVRASEKELVIVDCPLLFEAGLDRDVDEIWLVTAGERQKAERIIRRDGIDPKEADNRLGSQQNEAELEKRADVVLKNDGSVDELEEQIKEKLAI